MPPETDLETLLATLEGYIATLERYAAEVPWDRFVASEDEQNKVLYGLHKAIQCAIDAASLVVARHGLGPADTYRGVFHKLAGAGLLDADLADRLAGWAGLRNVIVHIYRLLDLERIHSAYAHETGDLRAFVAAARQLPPAETPEPDGSATEG